MVLTLKAARINAGLTQKEAAKALGVTDITLHNWEKGNRIPNTKNVIKIMKLYNIESFNDLIFIEQELNKN